MSAAAVLRGVRFTYPAGGFALSLDRWEVPPGSRVGVLGPSGCGKSTLLRLLSGELVPQAGSVEVAGTALGGLSDDARRAWRIRTIGFVFQDYPLVEHLDALENVLLPYRLHPALVLGREVRQRARGLLEGLGLGDKGGRLPEALSQGERQRVAIARALVTEPALLLADEPTTGLDSTAADVVMSLLERGVAGGHTTLVMVTHDPRVRHRLDHVLELGTP